MSTKASLKMMDEFRDYMNDEFKVNFDDTDEEPDP